MSDELWEKQWDIFHDALELPADERAAFVTAACARDAVLAEAVMKLLHSHEHAGDLLDEPLQFTRDAIDALQPEAMIGQSVGPYLIQEVIGEGGMGVVYAAEQTKPVQRRVAIKIIKLGMNTQEVVGRFELERQALASMSHPNIAKVFDAGATDDGRPYFVMEYVEGIPITEFCNRNCLNNQQRLKLCRQVFAGIQHAHQRGLIHRDIKPANVLIEQAEGEHPVAKVIDFGIAKATDQRAAEKTMFTQLGQLIGTPAYMSPEQAQLNEGDIDTRSDVYSLCVLLYELLTGAVPFESQELLSAGFAEMQRIIREQDPPTPSNRVSHFDAAAIMALAASRGSSSRTMQRELVGEIDWIIMKGLEKDPARRYESVAALAADVERHLHHRPVVAGPPGAGYRVQKFIRRHTWGVGAGALATIAILIFVTSTIMQSRQLTLALADAELEKVRAEQVAGFLVELLTQTDPNVAQGESVTVRQALDRGAQKIGGELDDQPEIKIAILVNMAEIYRELGLYEQAQQILEQAQEVSARQKRPNPASAGDLHQILANLNHDTGDYEKAAEHYAQALKFRRAALGAHTDTAMTLENFGSLRTDQGDYAGAEPLLQEALSMSRLVHDGDDLVISQALVSLGYNSYLSGDYASAGPLIDDGLAMTRRLYGDQSNQVATELNFVAIYKKQSGDFSGAQAALLESLAIYEKTLGTEHPYVATTLNNLSSSYSAAGQFLEAEKYAQLAVELYEKLFVADHPNKASAQYNLAAARMKLGHYAEAEQSFRQVLAVDQSLLGDEHPNVIADIEQIAMALKFQGRYAEAEVLNRDALARRIAILGADHPNTANAHLNLAAVLSLRDDTDEAESHILQAMDILQPVEPDSPRMLSVRTALASLYWQRGQLTESEALYLEILGRQRSILSADSPDIARSLHGLGVVLIALDKPARSELEEALRIRMAALGTEHPDTVATRQALGNAN